VRVLYLHQYFNTRQGSTGTRSYEFARRLVRNGHQVTMITSGRDTEPALTVPPGRKFIEVEVEGIHVLPIAAAYASASAGTAMSGYRRMWHFLHFARLASRIGKKFPRPDIVFATHTPLTIGLAGIELSHYFGVPFVFEVRDLWPQALINTGALKNPLGIWYLRHLERKIYRAADHIIALSPGIKAGIVSTGIRPEKVTVIPNGSDLDLFRPDVDGSAARGRLGLGDHFAAIYFGAMGLANGLEYVIEAARILQQRGRDDLRIVLHGEGGRRPVLEKLARQYQLRNVIFSNLVRDKTEVARIVAACNVCMTIYAATDREQAWSPNKMFDALAAGRPVIINVPGWLGETIIQNNCGRFVDPRRPEALADALIELADNPQLCREMGANARALAEREFARDKLAERFERVLLAALGGNT